MLTELQFYLTFENIYFWSNFAILPFWLMLIFIPNSKITQIFVNSLILPLILAAAYVYTIYQIILLEFILGITSSLNSLILFIASSCLTPGKLDQTNKFFRFSSDCNSFIFSII